MRRKKMLIAFGTILNGEKKCGRIAFKDRWKEGETKKKKLETKQNKKEKQIIHLIHKNKEKVTKN